MQSVLPMDTCPGTLPVGFPQLIGERGHGVRVSPARRDRSCGGSRRLGRRQRPEKEQAKLTKRYSPCSRSLAETFLGGG